MGNKSFRSAELRLILDRLWNADKTTLIFNFSSIGGPPGGKFDVELPLKSLAPFMKAGAPVP